MTEEQANKVVTILERNCVETDLRDDYSGRGMYGRMTHGVVCKTSMPELKEMLLDDFIEDKGYDGDDFDRDDYTDEELQELVEEEDWYPSLRSDSMGLSIIFY